VSCRAAVPGEARHRKDLYRVTSYLCARASRQSASPYELRRVICGSVFNGIIVPSVRRGDITTIA
jgi:hypothetical protein